MPGLIDCHVHVVACLANIGQNAQLPDSLIAYRARSHHERHADARLHHGARPRRRGPMA
jgi:imidazolonepropionase-like amidohydrolase